VTEGREQVAADALAAIHQRRGLVFPGFGRTITTQFEFITRAWTANEHFPRPSAGHDPPRDIEHVLCGGYFFVPPVAHADKPWTWLVPDPIADTGTGGKAA
jgi:hypothetical protein